MTTDTGKGGGAASGRGAAGESTDGGMVRVILYDADAGSSAKLREFLENIAGVRLVDTVAEVAGLVPSIEKAAADLVIANLDPSPDGIVSAVAGAAKAHPSLTYFAVSTDDDSRLIKTAMRSGFSDFVKLPEEAERLAAEIGQLRRRAEGAGSLGRIVTVYGSSGGVGCTTIAVNLAVELAEKCGREVALVDLNFQFGHVAMMLDLEIQHSISDLCGEGKQVDDRVVQKAVLKHKSGVHVVARPREFEDAYDLTAERCIPLLNVLRSVYPYVVLDGPARSDLTALSVLDIADWNLLTVQPLVTAARNAKRILGALEKYSFKGQPMQVICNRAGGGLSHLNTQRLEKSLGTKVLLCVPDDWTSVSAAVNLGEPLLMNAPKSKARESIRELADLIRGPGSDGAKKDSGLLSRFFKS